MSNTVNKNILPTHTIETIDSKVDTFCNEKAQEVLSLLGPEVIRYYDNTIEINCEDYHLVLSKSQLMYGQVINQKIIFQVPHYKDRTFLINKLGGPYIVPLLFEWIKDELGIYKVICRMTDFSTHKEILGYISIQEDLVYQPLPLDTNSTFSKHNFMYCSDEENISTSKKEKISYILSGLLLFKLKGPTLIGGLKFPKNPGKKIGNHEPLKIRKLQGGEELYLYDRDTANTLAHDNNRKIFTFQDLQKILPELQGNTEEEKLKHLYTMLGYPVFNVFDPKNDDIEDPSCDIWLPDIDKLNDVVMLHMNFDGGKCAIERNDHVEYPEDGNDPSYGALVIELGK